MHCHQEEKQMAAEGSAKRLLGEQRNPGGSYGGKGTLRAVALEIITARPEGPFPELRKTQRGPNRVFSSSLISTVHSSLV